MFYVGLDKKSRTSAKVVTFYFCSSDDFLFVCVFIISATAKSAKLIKKK